MGGTHALQLSLNRPDLVKALVLVNTFARLRSGQPDMLVYYALRFAMVHTFGLPAQARLVAKRIFPYPDQEWLRQELISEVVQANPQGYRAVMRALARFDVTSRLSEVSSPTLVITGDRDSTVPIRIQRQLVQNLPHCQQVTIANAGHAVIAERPQEFNLTLLEFLEKHHPI